MDYLAQACRIAKQAGELLLPYFYGASSHQVTIKADRSPVTLADTAANQFIVTALSELDASIPVLSEENAIPDVAIRQSWHRYWLVDPLDGTHGFIHRKPEFCVNIALIEKNSPILGVIYSPVEKKLSFAQKNKGAWLSSESTEVPLQLFVKNESIKHLHVLCGYSHQNAALRKFLLSHFEEVTLTAINSAIKFPRIAAGLADLYVRLGPTSEWDTAAGQCIVEEAGGSVVDFQGNSLHYNTRSSLINPSFMAIGNRAITAEVVIRFGEMLSEAFRSTSR